jgi:hypothetical protein
VVLHLHRHHLGLDLGNNGLAFRPRPLFSSCVQQATRRSFWREGERPAAGAKGSWPSRAGPSIAPPVPDLPTRGGAILCTSVLRVTRNPLRIGPGDMQDRRSATWRSKAIFLLRACTPAAVCKCHNGLIDSDCAALDPNWLI